jgi:hypothetical protein
VGFVLLRKPAAESAPAPTVATERPVEKKTAAPKETVTEVEELEPPKPAPSPSVSVAAPPIVKTAPKPTVTGTAKPVEPKPTATAKPTGTMPVTL